MDHMTDTSLQHHIRCEHVIKWLKSMLLSLIMCVSICVEFQSCIMQIAQIKTSHHSGPVIRPMRMTQSINSMIQSMQPLIDHSFNHPPINLFIHQWHLITGGSRRIYVIYQSIAWHTWHMNKSYLSFPSSLISLVVGSRDAISWAYLLCSSFGQESQISLTFWVVMRSPELSSWWVDRIEVIRNVYRWKVDQSINQSINI